MVLCHLLLLYSQKLVKVSGLICPSCSSVEQPHDCSYVEECKSNEECFIERIETHTGHVSYNVGCRDYHLCAQQQPFGKRLLTSQGNVMCASCCNNKDLCNLDGQCGSTKFVLRPGYKLCYDCPISSSPDNCNQLTLCDQQSTCMLTEVTNLLGETRWRHGCTQIQQCPSLSFDTSNACSFCCNSSLCNKKCVLPTITETHISSTVTTSTAKMATTAYPSQTKSKIISLNIQPQNFKYGDTVQITCVVTGNPPPNVDFMTRGGVLGPNIHVNGNHLTILNYSPLDDGEYRCFATNMLGDDMNQFSLQGQN